MMVRYLPDGSSVWDAAWFRVAMLPDCVVVTAAGEVDMNTAAGLDRALRFAENAWPHVVIDLSLVTFLDSTALGVLLGARARLTAARGTLALVKPPDLARRLLASTLLQQSFQVHDNLGEAIDALHGVP